MSYVFLKGSETNQENQSCILVPMSQGGNKMTYEGPENPAIVIELLSTNLCIAPAKIIPEDIIADNGNAGFEGKCVIEVDGKIVPHVFKVEDLPFYFNDQNTNGYGVCFTESKVLIDEPNSPEVGDSIQLTYQYIGPDGPRTEVWESGNEDVAT